METLAVLYFDDCCDIPIGAAKCPRCQIWTEIPRDYTTYPMIWCDECGGRYVLDLFSKEKSKVDLIEEYERAKDDHRTERHLLLELQTCSETEARTYTQEEEIPGYGEYIFPRGRGVDFELFSLQCCLIKKIRNRHLKRIKFDDQSLEYPAKLKLIEVFLNRIWTEANQAYNDKKIGELVIPGITIEPDDDRHDEFKEPDDSSNLISARPMYDPIKSIDQVPEFKLERFDFTTYLEVNSCDAFAPKIPYPKYFDLSHDGVLIDLLCVNCKGEEFVAQYWGD